MLIQLTQKEIESALRSYIVAQGISLDGKTVTTVFTASRKGAGISCEMDIDDSEIPGYESAGVTAAAVPAQTLQLVTPAPAAPLDLPQAAEAAPLKLAEDPVATPGEPEPAPEAKPASVSLFGG